MKYSSPIENSASRNKVMKCPKTGYVLSKINRKNGRTSADIIDKYKYLVDLIFIKKSIIISLFSSWIYMEGDLINPTLK